MLRVQAIERRLIIQFVTLHAPMPLSGEYTTGYSGQFVFRADKYRYHIESGQNFRLWFPIWRRFKVGELVEEAGLIYRLPVKMTLISRWRG